MLSIVNDNSGLPFIDGNYWSCFQNEDEKLYLGGLTQFTFECIRNIPENQKFSKPIKIINILNTMLAGFPVVGIKPVHSDIDRMSTMINAELDAVYLDDPYTAKLPLYSVHLFHQFLNHKTEIIINWEWMDRDFIQHHENADRDIYGFHKFRPLFVTENGSGNLKISYIVNLCENMETFVVMIQQEGR